jgi:MYXO-CTERM domain-containing protein
MKSGTRFVAAVLAASIALVSHRASATEDFPGVVRDTLSLQAITIDPPQGCRLCHETDEGGPALRPFGQLMQQYGVKPYDESSLKIALAQLNLDEPHLIDDIRAGRDPNDDTSGAANLHTPQYGCATAPRDDGSATAAALAALSMLLAAAIRRRRRAIRRARSS